MDLSIGLKQYEDIFGKCKYDGYYMVNIETDNRKKPKYVYLSKYNTVILSDGKEIFIDSRTGKVLSEDEVNNIKTRG